MDGQRFDQLTRSLAHGISRRGFTRALTAGAIGGWFAARGRAAAAQQAYYLGPGDSCYDDAQCLGADAPLYCADNGFDYDGPLNCCAFEGSRCGFDEACCGSLSCANGTCAFLGATAGYPATTGYPADAGYPATAGYPAPVDQGLNQTGYGFPPGQACISDSQCDNSFPELGIAYCADNGYIYGAYGGTLHCCRYEGGSCGGPLSDDHSLCCDGLLCIGGRCGWG
jgi:hypothetical protein